VSDFYNGLLGHAQQRGFTLDLQNFHRSVVDLSNLEQIFTEEEVWNTIKAMPSDKAPGPDGYTGWFYKAVWQVIKGDFKAAISRLLQGDVTRLYLLNSSLHHPVTQDGGSFGDQGLSANKLGSQFRQDCH
jgi:hypothetical protein